MLTIVAGDPEGMPEFKLHLPAADSASSSSGGVVEASLCGYVARNLLRNVMFGPTRFYRLVYRRGKNVSGSGTLPQASARRSHDDSVFVSEGSVDAEQEEHRLMAAEDDRQHYGVRS